MFSDNLTGKVRWRPITSWWGRHLGWTLQVEIEVEEGPCDSNGMPVWLAGKGWRDVTLGDLPMLDVSVSEIVLRGKTP